MKQPSIGKANYERIVKDALNSVSAKFDYDEPKNWKDLQNKTADIFSKLGCEVKIDLFIRGKKTGIK
jgi:hypothetical protein